MSTDALRDALERCITNGLTFAAFRTPGQPVQLWAQRTPELESVEGILLLELNQVFLLAPFDISDGRVPFIRSDVELLFGDIAPDVDHLNECVGSPRPASVPHEPTTQPAYARMVNDAKEAMANGALEKVVVSRTYNTPFDVALLPDLYLAALESDRNTCVVIANTPVHGLWMGASPERLVHEEEDHVRVDALAGTHSVSSAPAQISGWGEKEIHEQDLVTRHVLHTFVRFALKDVVSRGPELLRAGAVVHLHTSVEADLGDSALGDLVLALHPTPAVCGTPTAAAQAFLRTHEPHSRQLYSGFWGPWNADGPTDLFVNIRCMRVHGKEAQLFLGAGITKGSDADLEWAETEQKARTLLEPIGALRGAGIL